MEQTDTEPNSFGHNRNTENAHAYIELNEFNEFKLKVSLKLVSRNVCLSKTDANLTTRSLLTVSF